MELHVDQEKLMKKIIDICYTEQATRSNRLQPFAGRNGASDYLKQKNAAFGCRAILHPFLDFLKEIRTCTNGFGKD